MPAGVLAKPAAQSIPRHRRVAVAGNDHPDPGMTADVGLPGHVQPRGTAAPARPEHRLEITPARKTPAPREPLGRQAPPCFEGSRTASRLRPFLRRRFSTSRPQRVFARARNPCFEMRRLFRGR